MTENTIKIPVHKLNKCADLPKYAYEGDAGFDLMSVEDTEIAPQCRKIIKCGFSMSIPDGYAGLVLPRSGLAVRYGITVANSPGLVDSGYRGEICVVLLNTDNKNSFTVNNGDRIAQMIIVPFSKAEFCESDKLEPSQRSTNGFGSSGLQ